MRGGGALSPASGTNCSRDVAAPFAGRALPPASGVGATASSTRLFHAPQVSQRPAHFGNAAPHCWQTKRTDLRLICAAPC